jgi:site-specific recombinase XerD
MGWLRDRMSEDLILRNYSPATRRNYLLYAKQLAKFHNRSPQDLDSEDVRRFLLYQIQERKIGYNAYRQIYASLKFLYSVTLKRDWSIARIPFPRLREKRLPVVLDLEEVARLLGAIRVPRFFAFFATLYATGMRINEACHLQISDIDAKRMLLRVRAAKGGCERQTLLSPALLQELRNYWLLQKPKTWLFATRRQDKPPAPDTFRRAFAQICRDASLNKRCTPHVLRHCFATHLLDVGTDLIVVQALLGHNSIRSTCRYTHVSVKRIRQVQSPFDLLPKQAYFLPVSTNRE